MKTSQKGIKIDERDWAAFLEHLNATLNAFPVHQTERGDGLIFVESIKSGVVKV